MYIGTFRMLADGLAALVRLDLSPDAESCNYVLTNPEGTTIKWTRELDDDASTQGERAISAIAFYLSDCRAKGWEGACEIVQLGAGLHPPSWRKMLNFEFEIFETTIPEGTKVH